jgi:serine/threonine-protein kinase HipA
MSSGRNLEVYAHWTGMNDPVRIGVLNAALVRSEEILSFEYDAGWLRTHPHQLLDPYLRYYTGKYFPHGSGENFSLFLDSTPGSWGRHLIGRREAVRARKEKREARKLHSVDFLLEAFDYYRSGALRFRPEGADDFATSDVQYILPSLYSLKDLEHAVLQCSGDNVNDKEYAAALDLLTFPGAALGGSRPKANVIDNEWQMWLAKFPAQHDTHDIGGWEFVAHTLAGLAGIQTSPSVLKKLNGQYHTFVARRFDRNEKGERIHFASAMTMLGYSGDEKRAAASYLDIVEFIMRHGADVNRDLEELFRRIVFNIAISNTGDHLRNHGFLLSRDGWRLSPAYDLNPETEGSSLSLNISERDSSADFDLALSVADYFRVKPPKAKSIVQEVKLAAGMWRKIAADAGLTKAEQELMSRAFER